MKKKEKGTIGYLTYKKKTETSKTIVMFAVSFSLFLAGYITTKTKMNLLTIVAVLGMLPASRYAVSMVMYIKSKEIDSILYEKISPYISNDMIAGYDLFMTSYHATYKIRSIFVINSEIYGYTDDAGCDTKQAEKHIDNLLKQNNIKAHIKIFNMLPPYIERLQTTQGKVSEQTDIDQAIYRVLLAISL